MIEYSIPGTPADLQRVMDEVETVLQKHEIPPKQQYAVRLAMEELLLNIVRHAYDDKAVHPIDLKLDLEGPLAMIIEDDGKPFNPLQDAPAPVLDGPVEDRPVGGLGLHLLKNMGIRLDYRREGSRNRLRVDFPGE